MEDEPNASALAGNLLCAVPQLADPNFKRAVVLMLDHGAEGALGLVLNNPLPNAMEDVASNLGVIWAGPPEAVARVGGPVEPIRGWVLHDSPSWDPGAREVAEGVWLTTSLIPIQTSPDGKWGGSDMRLLFLLGYAGWGAGQLEQEIAVGSWVSVPVSAAPGGPGVRPGWVFDADPGNMWDEALSSIGVDPARLVGLQGSADSAGTRALLH